MKKVSVLLSDYNGGELVRYSIESVLAQTYQDYSFFLIDNGSTKDNTREILHSYTDPRIVHVDIDENKGLANAYNQVLKQITTPWVAIIDADDLWYPTKLEKQMAYLEQHPDYCLLGTWLDLIDANNKIIGTSKAKLTTWEQVDERYKANKLVVFPHSSVVFDRETALEVGGFHGEFWPTDDADMWSRMLETGKKACIYPEVLTMYRIHGASYAITSIKAMNRMKRYTVHCLKLRRNGQPEISYDEFVDQMKKRPAWDRFVEGYKDYTQYQYKKMVASYSARKWMLFIWHLIICALSNPSKVLYAFTKKH